ncbi:protein-disulfide reductase DsbD family protein [Sphingosinithalassobacter portus]|uniref:protein-disulfide reductase DsbD family protein n=1 Tax=Stakelama portus TaxID=2676234 RepID=UPI003B8378B0
MTMMLVLLGLIAAPASAQEIEPGPHIAIDLVAETPDPRSGSDVTLAFASTPRPGWHGYWRNPGDAGLAARLDWQLPDGVSVGELRYPVPERLLIAGLMNYVYEAPFAQLVTLHVPDGLAPGTRLPVAVKMQYLVCTLSICVPESAALSTELVVGDGTVAPATRARFDAWRQKLPKKLGSQATWQREGERIRIAIPYPAGADLGDAYLYPVTDRAIDYAADQHIVRDGDRLVVETAAIEPQGDIEAVLDTGDGDGLEITAVPGVVAPAAAKGASSSPAAVGWQAALIAFAGAVLGGLILNVMPCVFPILSLKALSLAKAGDDGHRPRAEALAYTAGVVLVCVALGAILLGVRAAGISAGWAFQLQSPAVILVLLLLVSAIAFNLAGLFELATPGFVNRVGGNGTGSAFATGALAAFVATPCTGPFMGAALGAALVLPWAAGIAVFAGLGLGIALPFLLLGFVPALRRILPRPGPWMERMRRLLSIPMFLTAVALAWVLGRQTGANGMALGLLAALAFVLLLWVGGRRQAQGRGFGLFALIACIAVTVIAVAAIAHVPAERSAPAEAAANAEPFSEERLAELRSEGRPVFAYFTADWCLTCKVNEKAVIETAPVNQAFADRDVAVLVGDWTDGDPVLGRFIEAHNRAGVPLYLWYAPDGSDPEVLPQILTQAMLRERSEAAGQGG